MKASQWQPKLVKVIAVLSINNQSKEVKMIENSLSKIKNCSENDALSMAFYLYQIVGGIEDLDAQEECQIMFCALVEKLGLGTHMENICDVIIQKYVKSGKLTIRKVTDKYHNPFDYRGKLKINYAEDESLYDNCGRWKTNSVRNINLVRAVFTDPKKSFENIVALTFFMDPETFLKKGGKLPSSVSIPAKIKKACENYDSVQFVVDALKLSKEEAALLQVGFRSHCIAEFYAVANNLYRNYDMPRIELYGKCLNKSQKELRLLLKADKKLKAYGFMSADGAMTVDAVDTILEKDMNMYFVDLIKKEKLTKVYDLNSFSIKQNKTDLAVQFLKSPNACNILLYGAPGAGKTEYAKALIREAGLKMVTYKNETEIAGPVTEEGEHKDNSLGRLNCYLSMKKDDSILVVDEAESVLKTVGYFFGMKYSLPQKGTVNKMLETSENKVIWILNYTDELDESTLRRFTYSIRFHEMPKTTLRSIAEKKFADIKMPVEVKSEILDMCGQYQITGASVENIVKAVKSMEYTNDNKRQIITDVKNVLEANSSLIYGKKKMRESVKDSYNLEILNTSTPAPELVEMIKNAIANREENLDSPEGIRMLFYGLSGTGKTELARYISEKTGKRLLLKRASDILGKYVGDNEQNIKQAFMEAEETDAILLFDEADSFFSDRNQATTSWERTMVNEFLTQMEEFSGILICTTNLRKIMDPAMQRRFHLLTEFKPLAEKGIDSLLHSFFPKYDFEQEQIKRLAATESVTPGDFGSLHSKVRFMSKDKISSEFIVQELYKLQSEKKMNGSGRIGFAS